MTPIEQNIINSVMDTIVSEYEKFEGDEDFLSREYLESVIVKDIIMSMSEHERDKLTKWIKFVFKDDNL